MSNETEMRDRFELFITSKIDGDDWKKLVTRKSGGVYCSNIVEDQWQIWKARDAEVEELKAENERLRNALSRAVNDVETFCDKGDEPQWTDQARGALAWLKT